MRLVVTTSKGTWLTVIGSFLLPCSAGRVQTRRRRRAVVEPKCTAKWGGGTENEGARKGRVG